MSKSRETNNFTQFADTYSEAGYEPDPSLGIAAQRIGIDDHNSFSFSPAHAAFTKASSILRMSGRSKRPLIKPVGEDPTLIYEMPVDSATSQLLDLVNSTVGTEYTTQPDAMFKSGLVHQADSCGFAEAAFANTVARMEKDFDAEWVSQPEAPSYSGFTLFTGKDSRPIILRKKQGIPTGMALEPLAINGAFYPAGSLVRVTTKDEKYLQGVALTHHTMPVAKPGVDVLPVTAIKNIGVTRLTLFASPPVERSALMSNGWNKEKYDLEMTGSKDVLKSYDIAEIQAAAYGILQQLKEN